MASEFHVEDWLKFPEHWREHHGKDPAGGKTKDEREQRCEEMALHEGAAN